MSDYSEFMYHYDYSAFSNHTGYNFSDYDFGNHTEYVSLVDEAIGYLNVIGIPLLVIFGTVGNTISFVVFLHTHLRYQSSSVYLAFLNIVDTGFLLSLCVTWFSWLDIHLFHRQGWCQGVVYCTYVFSFLSVWTVVAFTIERFIVVFKPLKRQQWCTRKRAQMVVCCLTLFALLTYSFALWTTKVLEGRTRSYCVPNNKYVDFLRIATFIDTALTFVIPSILIIFFNAGITYKVYHFFSARDPTRTADAQTRPNSSESGSDPIEGGDHPLRWPPQHSSKQSEGHGHQDGSDGCDGRIRTAMVGSTSIRNTAKVISSRSIHTCTHGGRSRRHFQIRTTRALLVVSSVFVVLNLPSHAFRIHAVVLVFLQDDDYDSAHQILLTQQVTQFLHYINFTINVLLYIACSRSFREALCRLYKRMRLNSLSRVATIRRTINHACSIRRDKHANDMRGDQMKNIS